MHNVIIRGVLTALLLLPLVSLGQVRTWQTNEDLSQLNLENPLAISDDYYQKELDLGIRYSLDYPVNTGVHFPHKPFDEMFTSRSKNPIKKLVQKYLKKITESESLLDIQDHLGLIEFPQYTTELEPLPFYIPRNYTYNDNEQKMGFTLKELNNTRAFTIGCAQCHTGNLFGKPVIGMSNRFPKPNEFFVQVKNIFDKFPAYSFKVAAKFSESEYQLLKDAQKKLKFVAAKIPTALGLDTSLAQVSLSLAVRNNDDIASIPTEPKNITFHPMNTLTADSKPMVWWNVKYKNKWLADGSVVSGNPILTNILWNEIGRGADLTELEAWAEQNSEVINSLTTSVFASQPPRMEDFKDLEYFANLDQLKKGQTVYKQHCARCHGVYIKGWETEATSFSFKEMIQTRKVIYSHQLDAIDVGTDPERHLAMKHLLPLNELKFSKNNNILIKQKKGYVPPPLDGIWARWPYLHNNSIPNLCELLTPSSKRVKEYMAREANNINLDFDSACNGYPKRVIDKASPMYFDSTKVGLSNSGHDYGIIIDRDGNDLMTSTQKKNLIYFLQTL